MADSNPTLTHLKVASHNVQGLNSPIKRRKAFHNYHSRHIDIRLLQETHFPKSYTPSFLHQNYPTFFLANADVKKREVAVLISKHTPFTHSHTIKDKEGRYILVKGHSNGELYTFISYYAPNQGQASFFSSMLSALSPYLEGWVVVGGDSNIAFDFLLDKSRLGFPHLLRPPKQSLRIARLLHSLGLIDSWREHIPSTKDYTHFSDLQETYARIYHIFIHSSDIHLTSGALIGAIPWLDHSLVTMQIEGSVTPVGPRQWHLNEWGAHKAVLRGKFIQLASHLKRQKQMDLINLKKTFQFLSKTHERKPTTDYLAKLEAARLELNLALTSSAEKHLRWTEGRFYLHSDKVGPQLASKLSPKHRTYTLPKIRSLSGSLIQNPERILETFHSFYSKLYSGTAPNPQTDLNTFPNDVPLPKLSDSHRSALESPITEAEVRAVMPQKGVSPRH